MKNIRAPLSIEREHFISTTNYQLLLLVIIVTELLQVALIEIKQILPASDRIDPFHFTMIDVGRLRIDRIYSLFRLTPRNFCN